MLGWHSRAVFTFWLFSDNVSVSRYTTNSYQVRQLNLFFLWFSYSYKIDLPAKQYFFLLYDRHYTTIILCYRALCQLWQNNNSNYINRYSIFICVFHIRLLGHVYITKSLFLWTYNIIQPKKWYSGILQIVLFSINSIIV